ncbi:MULTISPECIES: protein adenylyltransferase SelO [Cyanophyceae]|uniref:protein adenylyltransferase SelO n=1 Tax=Cyanophyceae TaxID=3028117 RepID=UPI001689B86D|nr:YdiU family protein [Trichocoleus sp. FACHB-69]MBD1933578.1 YdiU family protein [Trichocoleus sp. FACHB-69]
MTPENSSNPFLNLNYDPALEALGDDFFDEVAAAEFPKHILRFRNDELLPKLGLKPEEVTDEDFIEAFGKFQGRKPFLALRYHGYQFGEYNPRLGDGRGFLYGQVRGTDGELYDFGTKGSGTTPYSRGGDGRLTLKGGVREVLASEALHYLGVYTSRCLSMIETGDALWRGDEPSPTRSSVMVRFSRSHIRFGTFERLHHFGRKDLIQQLLDHVIVQYYPHLKDKDDRYALFYAELVQRVARLVAQWMSVGFCHAVLNTDNMSITGESFDYGPFAFIDTYNPQFTAAYFDYYGRYSYGNQPGICKLNLEMLQDPLSAVIPVEEMDIILKEFDEYYYQTYNERMLNKLGFANLAQPEAEALLMSTLTLLQKTQVGYHTFFSELTQQFNHNWRDDAANILKSDSFLNLGEAAGLLETWRNLYLQILLSLPESEMDNMLERLQRHNPKTVLLRPEIEAVWEKIDQEDNWEPFYQLISRLRFHQDAA